MARHQPFNSQRSTSDSYDYAYGTADMDSSITPDQSHTAVQLMYEAQDSTQILDFSDSVPQPTYPVQHQQPFSGFSDIPSQPSYLSPNPSQSRPRFAGFEHGSAAPFSISPYLFPVYQAFDENDRPNKQQIHQIAKEAGIQPHDVYMFSQFLQSKLRQHNPSPQGLITPDLTLEAPDRRSSTGATDASNPAPAGLKLPEDCARDIIRPAPNGNRQDPNRRHSGRGKRPRSASRGQDPRSALEEAYTAKRRRIASSTEVTAQRITEAHGQFECVSCWAKPKSVWRSFCDHEDKCHFPATYFKCQLCDYQCAKVDNGKNHLRTATGHRQYADGEELDEMHNSCTLDGQHIFHDACGFEDCQATFNNRTASRNHIRAHIKSGCKRSQWTHRCKMRHPFCLELPHVEAVRPAIRDQDHVDDNDDDDDDDGGNPNGHAGGHSKDGSRGGEADKDDDTPRDDDDDNDTSGGGAGRGATDVDALGDPHSDFGNSGLRDADLDHALRHNGYGNMFLETSWTHSHFGRETEATLELTHITSRLQGEDRSQQIDFMHTDLHHRLPQTMYQECFPCREKFFKVELKPEYYARVTGDISSRNLKSDVIAFRFIRTLGQGGFGTVHEVENPYFPGNTFALKIFKQTSGPWSAEEMFCKERDALERLCSGHPHLIDFLGSGSSGGQLGILMSPVADMDLAQFLRVYSHGILSWTRTDPTSGRAIAGKTFGASPLDYAMKEWAMSSLDQICGLASAVSHIHAIEEPHGNFLCHADIKPTNVLVKMEPHGYKFLLADLGLASFSTAASTERSKPLAVTPMYSAPECNRSANPIRQPTRSIDIWSLGCVYSEILTWMLGIPIEAFESFRSPDPNDRAFYSKRDRVKLWLDKLGESAKCGKFAALYHSLLDTTWKMMSNNPDDRPTAKEVYSAFSPDGYVNILGEKSDVAADSRLPPGGPGIDQTVRSNNPAGKYVLGSGNRRIGYHVVQPLINRRPLHAVLDTGSLHNVISRSLVSRLDLAIDTGHRDLTSFQLAHGTGIRPVGRVVVNFALEGCPERKFLSVFYVMEDISATVLGRPTVDKLQLLTKNQHLVGIRPAKTNSPPRCLQLSALKPTLKCKVASRPESAVIDTGCDVNLVSHEFVLRRRLQLERPSPDVEWVQLANGKTIRITGRVTLKVTVLPGDCDMPPMKTQRVTFHVMPRLRNDILLGNGLISHLEVDLEEYLEQWALTSSASVGL